MTVPLLGNFGAEMMRAGDARNAIARRGIGAHPGTPGWWGAHHRQLPSAGRAGRWSTASWPAGISLWATKRGRYE